MFILVGKKIKKTQETLKSLDARVLAIENATVQRQFSTDLAERRQNSTIEKSMYKYSSLMDENKNDEITSKVSRSDAVDYS